MYKTSAQEAYLRFAEHLKVAEENSKTHPALKGLGYGAAIGGGLGGIGGGFAARRGLRFMEQLGPEMTATLMGVNELPAALRPDVHGRIPWRTKGKMMGGAGLAGGLGGALLGGGLGAAAGGIKSLFD